MSPKNMKWEEGCGGDSGYPSYHLKEGGEDLASITGNHEGYINVETKDGVYRVTTLAKVNAILLGIKLIPMSQKVRDGVDDILRQVVPSRILQDPEQWLLC